MLAGHLYLDILANRRNFLYSLSVNYFSLKHTLLTSQVTNHSSSQALTYNQFPQRINFQSSLSLTLPLSTDDFHSTIPKTYLPFSIAN